jgi:predicted ATP-grasp superfamily ATP-dependent carboligase
MKVGILRRQKLGNTSCREISKKSQHEIKIIRNDKINPSEKFDLIVRWGTTSDINSDNFLNHTDAIRSVNNKVGCRTKMLDAGISCPQINNIDYPFILRPTLHSQGKDLYLCNNIEDFNNGVAKLKGRPHYISEYIKKDEEWGIFVFQGRISSMIKKEPKTEEAKNAIAWNVSQGSHTFENVNWDQWDIKVALESLKAMKLFNLDFGRVDVIVKDGVPYVLEINSAHSLTSEYRQTIFAKCLDWFIEKGKPSNELDYENCKSYKSIIHPSLRENQTGSNL